MPEWLVVVGLVAVAVICYACVIVAGDHGRFDRYL